MTDQFDKYSKCTFRNELIALTLIGTKDPINYRYHKYEIQIFATILTRGRFLVHYQYTEPDEEPEEHFNLLSSKEEIPYDLVGDFLNEDLPKRIQKFLWKLYNGEDLSAYQQKVKWLTHKSVEYVSGATERKQFYAFDLDHTLIRPVNGAIFYNSVEYLTTFPNVVEQLRESSKKYGIVIFTNQLKYNEQVKSRIENFLFALNENGIYPWLFAATAEDKYRKPKLGMVKLFSSLNPEAEIVRYIGDLAEGYSKDPLYSSLSTDYDFAQAMEIKFQTPDQFFKYSPDLSTLDKSRKTMILMVGVQGSGKSTFIKENLPSKYEVVSQDVLKTKAKVLSRVKAILTTKKGLVIDRTHPSQESRAEFIDLAKEAGYRTVILWSSRPGEAYNGARERKVPIIALRKYYKDFEPPSDSEGEVIRIN